MICDGFIDHNLFLLSSKFGNNQVSVRKQIKSSDCTAYLIKTFQFRMGKECKKTKKHNN